MNFLSHYYFDREAADCYHILGTVLPDLLKNADKTLILHPEKLHHKDNAINSIVAGWKTHLDVDRYFHSSDFFIHHSHQLKKMLLPIIEGSPVKPFFLGHIAIELILDNLLITTGKISVDGFYSHLNACDDEVIREFLTLSGMKEPAVFIRFFDDFKESRYLETYAETIKIAYALRRVCMRVWKNPFTPEQELNMNEILEHYRLAVMDEFMVIFDEIDLKLKYHKAL